MQHNTTVPKTPNSEPLQNPESLDSRWKSAAKEYETRLEAALDLRMHALRIPKLVRSQSLQRQVKKLNIDVEPLEKQLDRLRKNEFRICVVGVEKAGKSTFINSWLGYPLLPHDAKRCTYTTTRIHTVSKQDKQRVEVDVLTLDELSALSGHLEELSKQQSEEGRRAKEDLEQIRKHDVKIKDTIKNGHVVNEFSDIKVIDKDLKQYVADPQYAYAVREVRLYTNVFPYDGVVFYDVPGLDSGLERHIQESRQMLTDCDAVIFIQRANQPNLTGPEQELIKFVVEGDSEVGIAGKLFVFFGQIDRLKTSKALEETLAEARIDWQIRGNLSSERIIPGSAGAWLLLNEQSSGDLSTHVGEPRTISAHLKMISSVKDDAELLDSTGIPVIRRKLEKYLADERIAALRKRCDTQISLITSVAREIHRECTGELGLHDSVLQAEKKLDEEQTQRLHAWWANQWPKTVEAIMKYFWDRTVVVKAPDKSAEGGEALRSVDRLRHRYNVMITQRLPKLPSLEPSGISTFFEQEAPFTSEDGSRVWRKAVYRDVTILLDEVSMELAEELQQEADKFVEFATRNLWESRRVSENLKTVIGGFSSEVSIGLRSLFLRFARPLSETLIAAPVGSQKRQKFLQQYSHDIEMLSRYYPGTQEVAFSKLREFIQHGHKLLFDAPTRKQVLQIENVSTIEKAPELFKHNAERQHVVNEVFSDLRAFRELLVYSVFDAAGFEAFCEQQLRRLRERFIHLEETQSLWRASAQLDWQQKNPQLMAFVPNSLKDPGLYLETAKCLEDLSASLKTVNEIEVKFDAS